MSGSGISWAICKSAPRSRQITTPAPHHSVFYRPYALPAAQPTASKHYYRHVQYYTDKSPRHCRCDSWFCTAHGHTASNVVVQISTLSKKYSGHVRNCGTNVLDQEQCQEASFRPPKKSIECQRCSTNSWRQLTDCGCCCQQPMLEIGVQNFITYSGALGAIYKISYDLS